MTESEDAFDNPLRSSRVPIILLVLLVVGGIGSYLFFGTRGRNADHVAVRVQGCSQACSDTLGKRLGVVLVERGFILDESTSPERGGHLVTLNLDTQETRESIDAELISVQAKVSLSTQSPKHRNDITHDIQLMGDASNEDAALVELGISGIKALADDAVANIVGTEAVRHYINRDVDAPELPRRDKIAKSRKELTRRKWEKRDWDEHCAENSSADSADCLSRGCQEEYAIGLSPDGSLAYSQEETGAPIFPIGAQGDVRRAETPDKIVSIDVKSGKRETLYVSPDIYTYASLSEDGRYIVFIERINTMHALIVLDTKSKARRFVYRVAAPGRLAAPKISAKGGFASVVYRKAVGVKTRVLMFNIKGDKPVMSSPVRFGIGSEWLQTENGPRLVVLIGSTQSSKPKKTTKDDTAKRSKVTKSKAQEASETDKDAKRQDIFDDLEDTGSRKDLAPGLPPLAHAAIYNPLTKSIDHRVSGVDHALSFVAGVQEGNIVFLYATEMGKCGVGHFDLIEKTYTYGEEGACIDRPIVVGDAIVASGFHAQQSDLKKADEEIISLSTMSLNEVKVLTKNNLRDRRPRRARDVGRVIFERKRTQRYFRHPRASVCILDITARRSAEQKSDE